VKLNNLL